MSLLFFHFRDGVDQLLDPEGIELPDLEAAKANAIRNAYSIMADELSSKGKLNLNYLIDIADEAGNVLHTVHFRDLVEVEGMKTN